jgi:hypothetical protein
MAPPVQLRVLVTGVRVKEALPYYLQLQVSSGRVSAANSVPLFAEKLKMNGMWKRVVYLPFFASSPPPRPLCRDEDAASFASHLTRPSTW